MRRNLCLCPFATINRSSTWVKQAAMGSYLMQKWGRGDDYQFAVHQRHFEEKPFSAIERGRARIGTISVQKMDRYIQGRGW